MASDLVQRVARTVGRQLTQEILEVDDRKYERLRDGLRALNAKQRRALKGLLTTREKDESVEYIPALRRSTP